MANDVDTIVPPRQVERHLRSVPVPTRIPDDPVELEILRLRLLHPELRHSFRIDDVAGLDADTKKEILASMREVLGVIPLKGSKG